MSQPPGDDPRSQYRASGRPRLRSDRSAADAARNGVPLSRKERVRQERQRAAPPTAAHGIASARQDADAIEDENTEAFVAPARPVSAAASYAAAHETDSAPASGSSAAAGVAAAAGSGEDGPPLSRRALRESQSRRTSRRARRNDHADERSEAEQEELEGDEDLTRHSTGHGEDFGTIVTWTTAGTIFPGSGLIKAGRKGPGLFILLGFYGLLAAVLVWLFVRGPVSFFARLGTSPDYLLGISIIAAVGGLIWIGVMLATYRSLRAPAVLTRLQKALSGIMVASLTIIIGIPLGIVSYYSVIQRSTIATVFGDATGTAIAAEDLWADEPHINVLLLGRDNGSGREGIRPDTIMVASIDTQTGNTTMISVPRNLAMPIFPEGSALEQRFPQGFNAFGTEESLINAVWTWAESEPESVDNPEGLEPGMWATMQAVEGSLGLELNYYGSVDMKGFEDLVDAIGGVNIDVERPVPMGGGTNLRTGLKNPIVGWIDPGEQNLDGYHALWYVRSREGADNYDRMCRQQRMLKTTLDQVDPAEIAMAYPKLAGSASENIQSDIPQNELGAFVELALRMQGAEIKSAQINNEVITTYNPDFDELHAWVQEQIDPEVPSQAEEAAEEPTTEAETTEPEETEAPAPGVETSDGKCLPQGYDPSVTPPGYTPNSEG